jgi:urea transport system ATP-binding protein
MLAATELDVRYGDSQVVHGVSFVLAPGETVAVMGRNGMGKTTLFKALIGLLPLAGGSLKLNGVELKDATSHKRVRAGLGYVPQGRLIFQNLTVEENIQAGMELLADRRVPDWVYQTFPVLKDMARRKGGNLSGGQQQQLAIARALVGNPKVLILDEPTEGLQPSIIKDIARTLNVLRKERHFGIVVSEQVLSFALDLADRFLVIDCGRIVHEESRASLDLEKVRSFLTV